MDDRWTEKLTWALSSISEIKIVRKNVDTIKEKFAQNSYFVVMQIWLILKYR